MKKHTTILCLLFFLSQFSTFAQLNKPTIKVSGIGFNTFTLSMTGQTGTPLNTRWVIYSDDFLDTLLDTRWGVCDGKYFAMNADKNDLTTKVITGAPSNTLFTASVSYNNGTIWSPMSDPVDFQTLVSPVLTGTDTTFVLLWGHSFLSYGDQCETITRIRLGDYQWDYMDNLGVMLGAELQRLSGRKIFVINNGVSGTRHSDWFSTYYSDYQAGGMYANRTKFPLAIFFFGANDCANSYPDADFGRDMRTVTDSLTKLGFKVMYNSIHHTHGITEAFNNPYWQADYRNRWATVMNGYAANANVRAGVDLYTMFMDKHVYIGQDGVHPNLSEGTPEVARQLAPVVLSMLSAPTVLTPLLPLAGATASTSPLFVWSGTSGAYQIQVADNASFTSPVVDKSGITGTMYMASGLTADKAYYWRVRLGAGVWSSARAFRTMKFLLASPALTAPANGATKLPINTQLSWQSVSGATGYRIQISEKADFSTIHYDEYVQNTAVEPGNLAEGKTYYWRVNAFNYGDFSDWQTRNFATGGVSSVGVAGESIGFFLSQNYPNPLSRTTRFSYGIGRSTLVKLSVFNALGVEIATLANGFMPAGIYSAEWNADNMPAGVYYYRLSAGEFSSAGQMTVYR